VIDGERGARVRPQPAHARELAPGHALRLVVDRAHQGVAADGERHRQHPRPAAVVDQAEVPHARRRDFAELVPG
jgi:hypothetical protein